MSEPFPPAPPAQPGEPSPFAAPQPVRADVGRGTLLALLVIPAGVVLWVVLWGMGFIASLVGALVAFVALRLYLRGAGTITRAGAGVVVAITAVTLALAFLGGIVLDFAQGFSTASGGTTLEAVTHPAFWPLFGELLPEAFPSYLPDLAWAVGFGALGSFSTLRSAFAASRAAAEPAPGYGVPPQGHGYAPHGYGTPPQGYGTPPQGYAPPAPQGDTPPAPDPYAPPPAAPDAETPGSTTPSDPRP